MQRSAQTCSFMYFRAFASPPLFEHRFLKLRERGDGGRFSRSDVLTYWTRCMDWARACCLAGWWLACSPGWKLIPSLLRNGLSDYSLQMLPLTPAHSYLLKYIDLRHILCLRLQYGSYCERFVSRFDDGDDDDSLWVWKLRLCIMINFQLTR